MAADPGFDAARLGVFGGSYGGFATLLCATQMPDVWKCAVDMFRGVEPRDDDRERAAQLAPVPGALDRRPRA